MNQHRGSDFNEFLIEQGLTNTDQPMTPTPRTDAAEILWNDTGWCVVPAEFARYLERELAELRKNASELIASLQTETDSVERELAAERALADRLAGVLLSYDHNMLAGDDMQWLPEHDKALAAWREARK